ncbi:hypothetical protein ACRALDRAFT_1054567 [Sodiomyces alcalophilus JCM 7366]|uniref:uncharacterized protein n=1 Tax=Sodiomyces alcalophilus JCM 7366 TaxID=591952 RepID=UPI0039B48EA2
MEYITVTELPQTVTVVKTIREPVTETVKYPYEAPVTVTKTVEYGGQDTVTYSSSSQSEETVSLYLHPSSATYGSETTRSPVTRTSTHTRYVYGTQPPTSAKDDEYNASNADEYGREDDCTGEGNPDSDTKQGEQEYDDETNKHQEDNSYRDDEMYHSDSSEYQVYDQHESGSYRDGDDGWDSYAYSLPSHPEKHPDNEKYTNYEPSKPSSKTTQPDPVTEYATVSPLPSPSTTTSTRSITLATPASEQQTEYEAVVESTAQLPTTSSIPCDPTAPERYSAPSSEPTAYSAERNSYLEGSGYSYDKRMPKVPGKRMLGSRWVN